MKKSLLLLALLSTCGLPPPAYSHHGNLPQHLDKDQGPLVNEVEQQLYEVNYPTLFLLQWTYQCSQQMQPQFEYQGMPKPLALQFSIQQCSCVIDEFRKHYRYEETISMDFNSRAAAATRMAESCLVGVNTDKQI